MCFPWKRQVWRKRQRKSESKGKSGESDGRSIRLISCVLGDADLQFFCSRNNREGERQRDREYISRVRGWDKQGTSSGSEHSAPAVALGCYSSWFFSGGNGVSDLHYAAFKLQCWLYYKVQKNLLYFQWPGLTWCWNRWISFSGLWGENLLLMVCLYGGCEARDCRLKNNAVVLDSFNFMSRCLLMLKWNKNEKKKKKNLRSHQMQRVLTHRQLNDMKW